jgi:endonuclease/exonuclease/phosphatase (EEP) superfamily protein YafD
MFTPKSNLIHPNDYPNRQKQNFTLLCWNIHKENDTPRFESALKHLKQIHDLDFLVLQEYKFDKKKRIAYEGFNVATVWNIETKRYAYGLLTASKSAITQKQSLLSEKNELLFATKKAMLLTFHTFDDGALLAVVNLHAINFVPFFAFKLQLMQMQNFLQTLDCAVIVCGDFNSWGFKRAAALDAFEKESGFKKALLENERKVKHLFYKPLDRIYYKNLRLSYAKAIDIKGVSDHNPLVASFLR